MSLVFRIEMSFRGAIERWARPVHTVFVHFVCQSDRVYEFN